MVQYSSHITTHSYTCTQILPLSHCKMTRALPGVHNSSMAGLWPTSYNVTLWSMVYVVVVALYTGQKQGRTVVTHLCLPISELGWGEGISIPGYWPARCCCWDDEVLFSGQTAQSALLTMNVWGLNSLKVTEKCGTTAAYLLVPASMVLTHIMEDLISHPANFFPSCYFANPFK